MKKRTVFHKITLSIIGIFMLAVTAGAEATSRQPTVKSPDGQLQFKLLNSGSGLKYAVTWKGNTIISPSALGPLVGRVTYGADAVTKGVKAYSIDETYSMHGGKKSAENKCNGARFELLSQGKYRWTLDVRCYDDGIGFRYILKDMSGDMTSDAASFKFAKDSMVWYTSRLEAPWDNREKLQDMASPTSMVFPITLELPSGGYAVINEAETLGFTSSRMTIEEAGLMRIRFNGTVPKQNELKSAWRAVMLTETLDEMVNSTLYANLCPAPDPKWFPEGADADWIKPGRTLWQWWAYLTKGVEWSKQKWFVDKAAELQCLYYLVDEGWQDPKWGWVKDGKDEFAHLKELCDYAATKGVKILVWAAKPEKKSRFWPGTETRGKADDFLVKVAAAGAKGVKMDFIGSDDHETMVWYKNILEVSAEHKLLVNFHGCTKPAGETRTYPNELDREDVYGIEQYHTGRLLSGRHFTALPFTRYAAGHGDITETVLNRHEIIETTLTLQLAQGVIYTSPLKCWADRPDVYTESNASDIIRTMPPVWDETIVLPGSEIGECAAFARRDGNDWWIGVINGNKEELTLAVKLDFLAEGDWVVTSFEDDFASDYMDWKRTDAAAIKGGDNLKVRMKPSGGYVARLTRFAPDSGGRFYQNRRVGVKGRNGNSYTYKVTPGMNEPASYSQPVSINQTCRFDVKCVAGSDKGASVSSWFHAIETPEEPIILPADRNVTTKEFELVLTTEDPQIAIHYTLDGSKPTSASKRYKGPVIVKSNTEVKAIAVLDGKKSSESVARIAVPVPAFEPKSGWSQEEFVEVAMQTGYSNTQMYYTLDGSEPASKSTPYTGRFTVANGAVIKAVTMADGVPSDVVYKVYGSSPKKGPSPDVHAADLKPKRVMHTVGTLKLNKSFGNQPLAVLNKQYAKGLGTHANSELVYSIPAGSKRFVATVGTRGSVTCTVEIDGKTVAATPMLTKKNSWNFNIEIPSGAKEIKLISNDGGNGRGGDHVNWVDCGFLMNPVSSLKSAETKVAGAVVFPGAAPGVARVKQDAKAGEFSLKNDALALDWKVANKRMRLTSVKNLLTGKSYPQSSPLFVLKTGNSNEVSDWVMCQAPVLSDLKAELGTPSRGNDYAGKALTAEFESPSTGIRVRWIGSLRDQAGYLRTTINISGTKKSPAINHVQLLNNMKIDALVQMGNHRGGNAVRSDQMFFGVEVPFFENSISGDTFSSGFGCELSLNKGKAYTFSAVVAVFPEGQLRRTFLHYLERERARSYKPFLHYNCWFDFRNAVSEELMLDRIKKINMQLTQKRGVSLDSYVIDDGYDDFNKGFWAFDDTKFPDGFTKVAKRLADVDSNLGLWLSPSGGYGGRKERIARAQEIGIEKLDLSVPAYYEWFLARHQRFIQDEQVNYFKWDRLGNEVNGHFMALVDIAHKLREVKPDLFINTTAGTWQSPFWLNHVDCTWRSGKDVGFRGKGDEREQWLTFRDGISYESISKSAMTYPLNALMIHGIVFADGTRDTKTLHRGSKDLRNEVRSYFGGGYALQELYINPDYMTADQWNAIADGAKWARDRADILVDAHFIGGNPNKLEVYGFAAWRNNRGTITLRNPNDVKQRFNLDVATAFELPAGAASSYTLTSPYADQRVKRLNIVAGKPLEIELMPFEVLVFDAVAR
jgi:hypothetical protein